MDFAIINSSSFEAYVNPFFHIYQWSDVITLFEGVLVATLPLGYPLISSTVHIFHQFKTRPFAFQFRYTSDLSHLNWMRHKILQDEDDC